MSVGFEKAGEMNIKSSVHLKLLGIKCEILWWFESLINLIIGVVWNKLLGQALSSVRIGLNS